MAAGQVWLTAVSNDRAVRAAHWPPRARALRAALTGGSAAARAGTVLPHPSSAVITATTTSTLSPPQVPLARQQVDFAQMAAASGGRVAVGQQARHFWRFRPSPPAHPITPALLGRRTTHIVCEVGVFLSARATSHDLP